LFSNSWLVSLIRFVSLPVYLLTECSIFAKVVIAEHFPRKLLVLSTCNIDNASFHIFSFVFNINFEQTLGRVTIPEEITRICCFVAMVFLGEFFVESVLIEFHCDSFPVALMLRCRKMTWLPGEL
jgi:hypothetical protein